MENGLCFGDFVELDFFQQWIEVGEWVMQVLWYDGECQIGSVYFDVGQDGKVDCYWCLVYKVCCFEKGDVVISCEGQKVEGEVVVGDGGVKCVWYGCDIGGFCQQCEKQVEVVGSSCVGLIENGLVYGYDDGGDVEKWCGFCVYCQCNCCSESG